MRTEIINFMLQSFKDADIEDTPRHRFEFLMGLRDAWLEDPQDNDLKQAYMNVLAIEIVLLNLQLRILNSDKLRLQNHSHPINDELYKEQVMKT